MSKKSKFNQNLMKAIRVTEKRPKMTVNKLGEFLIANPKRQRRILELLKYPKESTYSATAHSEAREAIKKYFINEFDDDIILDCIEFLKQKTGGSEHSIKMDQSSIDLLEVVLESDSVEFESYNYEKYEGDNPKLDIAGVTVSVYPDLIAKSSSRGKEYIGALKIHLGKTAKLGLEGGKYAAAILNHFVSHHVESERIARPDHSVSYDVYPDSFIECPTSVKRRWDDIEAGCQNIVAIWDSI